MMVDAIFVCPACGGPVKWEAWRVDERILATCCGALLQLEEHASGLRLVPIDVDETAPAGKDDADW